MLNSLEMIANITKQINDFKKDNLDSLLKIYNEKMGKITELRKQLAEVPEKYKGKSKTFISKKRKQLMKKIEDLTKKVNDWYDSKKKEALDKIQKMLTDSTNAVKAAVQEEKDNENKSKETANNLSNS